jgi:hypothetical protein
MNWTELIYQYVIGGIFFFVTLYLCFRPGASDTKNPSDKRALKYLLIGFFGYLFVHTAWILFATYV